MGVVRLSVDSVGNANRLIETDQEKLILRTSRAISSHENLQSAVREKAMFSYYGCVFSYH